MMREGDERDAATAALEEELRRLRDALAATTQGFSQAFHASPVGISVSVVSTGRIVDMNEEFLRILGFTREEVIGRTSHQLGLWVSPGQRDEIVREYREQGRYPARPIPMHRKDGSTVHVLFSASALAVGTEPHTIAWVVDITERLAVEEQLRVSEEKWRSLVENAPAVVSIVERDGTVVSVNQTITRRPRSEVVGANAFALLPAEGREEARAMLARVFATGESAVFRGPVAGPDGGLRWFEHRLGPIGAGDGVSSVIVLSTDITPQMQAEAALRESEQRFGDIVRSMGDWVWEVDLSQRLVYSSPQVEDLLGYPAAEMLGRSPWETCDPGERRRQATQGRDAQDELAPFRDREIWHLHRDGHRVCLSVSGVPVYGPDGVLRGFRGVAHDVTRRKREEEEHHRLEAEVQQARRVESLGVLAGGIAHDFNNILSAVLGNAELALADLPDGSTRQLVSQIQAAGLHAAELTRQMLAYAGRGRLAVEAVDVSAAVRAMDQLLRASVPKKVELSLQLADGLPAVSADPAQLRQVVMNLVINAADAIGDREGRIEVRTGEPSPAQAFAANLTLGAVAAGCGQVCIEVADSGGGIGEGALPKIFDPFFTTKFAGRGLGLAAVQGIVLRHGGSIAVRSGPGAGATFRVTLPALAETARPPAPPTAPAAAPAWRGSGTVLLVDDEAPVRRMAAKMLESLGFSVLAAADGREAVGLCAENPGLRAALLDLMMPHMDGSETCRELRRLRPQLPVVLCSGYDVHESADRFADLGLSGFLQKPYRLSDLALALRGALGE